jgi:hypothetical protein
VAQTLKSVNIWNVNLAPNSGETVKQVQKTAKKKPLRKEAKLRGMRLIKRVTGAYKEVSKREAGLILNYSTTLSVSFRKRRLQI